MIRALRRVSAACVALSLTVASLPAAADTDDAQHAISLLNQCGEPAAVAQAQASASPSVEGSPAGSPSPSPSATPTLPPLVGPPIAPGGPQTIVPPPLPTTTPVPPPPVPTPGPTLTAGPVIIQQATFPPEPTPVAKATASAGPVVRPTPTPTATPAPGETLGPDDYAILGDRLTGKNAKGEIEDLDGNVTILYQQGVIGGDHAHYDGRRYIDVTGRTFVRNAAGDTVFYADSIRFDTLTQQAILLNGRGESTNGVERGKLYFKGTTMVTDHDGVTHVQHANLTTCDNPRGGYHMESKTLDIYPGDKAVARSDVLYLGALAVLWLPIVVISLRQDQLGSRRNPGFFPLVGYSQAEGFWIKLRIGF